MSVQEKQTADEAIGVAEEEEEEEDETGAEIIRYSWKVERRYKSGKRHLFFRNGTEKELF